MANNTSASDCLEGTGGTNDGQKVDAGSPESVYHIRLVRMDFDD